MLPTATGAIVIVLGIWCQLGDYRRVLVSMIILTLFEAADAADLVALGGASVTPARLFLLFFVLRLASMRDGVRALVAEIAPTRVFFIYLLLLIWVVASGLLLPRLFMGAVDVFSLERTVIDTGVVPLKPSTGNITQTVYAIGGFVIAVGTCVLARKPGAYATILSALLWLTGLDLFFAVFDLVTWATHTGFILDAIHTGAYAFLTADESNGMKRISGTFAETSAFSSFSLELLAINLTLFVARVRPWLTGFYCVGLLACLGLSTSSTAYVGLGTFGLAFGLAALYALLRSGNARPLKVFAASLAIAVFLAGVVLLLAPKVATVVGDMLDVSLLQKSQSESALERGELNTQSMKIFLDTYGMGSGIGSTRSSNYILVLASNLGIIGLALFALLIGALALSRLRPDLSSLDRSVVAAARAGLLGTLVPATLIGVIFDLGPLFYMLIGIVASGMARGAAQPVARPELRLVRRRDLDSAVGMRR